MKDRSDYKAVWEKCVQLCLEYIQKGIAKQPEIEGVAANLKEGRKEFAIGSRYIHRGFYCPSPSIEHIITNIRRGKIAKRLNKRSRLTNAYLFDAEENLRIAETFYTNGAVKTEYLFYEDSLIYGVSYNNEGHVEEISIEQYEEGQIQEYLWACCCYNSSTNSYLIFQMLYEAYHYDHNGYLDVEFYNMSDARHDAGKSNRYRFHLDADGKVSNNKKQQ